MLRPNSAYNPREANRLRSSVDLGFNPEAYKHVFLTEAEKHTVTQMHAINQGHTQALGTETTTKAVISNGEARSMYSRTNKKANASSIIFGDDGGEVKSDSTRKLKHKSSARSAPTKGTTDGEEEQPRKQLRPSSRALMSNISSVGFAAGAGTDKAEKKNAPTQNPLLQAACSSPGLSTSSKQQFGKENLDSTLRPKTPAKLKRLKEKGVTKGSSRRMGEEHLSLSGLVPPPNAHHPPSHGVGLGLDHPQVSEMLMHSKLGQESGTAAAKAKRGSRLLTSRIF